LKLDKRYEKMKKEPKILIIGLCALPMGTMERQLGNLAILIPMIKTIKEAVPDARISTSLQLSEGFCREHGITCLDIKSLYKPVPSSGVVALVDYLRSGLWSVLRKYLKINAKFLIGGRKLKEFREADIVLDFSGDTFGDMAHPLHLMKHSCDILSVLHLGKPYYMYAASPGPFSTGMRMFLAKKALNKMTLITSREPRAYETIKQSNLTRVPVIRAACPAFLLEPASEERAKEILSKEGIKRSDRPLVGVSVCGFNFSTELVSKDKYKERRTEEEMEPVLGIIRHLLDEQLNMDVMLIPHVYRTDDLGNYVAGPDTRINEQIYDTLQGKEEKYGDQLQFFRGFYKPNEIKSVIGQCDMFVSGRIHAGVGAMSQAIPTILLAYGIKFFGFARLVGQERFVSDGLAGKMDAEDVISKIDDAWKNRETVSQEIEQNMKHVRDLASFNATLVKEILDLEEDKRMRIPEEKIAEWTKMSDKMGKWSKD